MTMKTAMTSATITKLTSQQLKALVAYCLSVNIACPDLTIGEIHEFVVANGKRPVTMARTQRCVDNMALEGMAGKRSDFNSTGKKRSHRYYPLEKSVRLCLAYADYLPTKLNAFADALFQETHMTISRVMGHISSQNKTINGGISPVDFAAQQELWDNPIND